jgi:hypothetical protein
MLLSVVPLLIHVRQVAFTDIGPTESDCTSSDELAPIPSVGTLLNPSYLAGARVFSNSWGCSSEGCRNQYRLFDADVDQYVVDHPVPFFLLVLYES